MNDHRDSLAKRDSAPPAGSIGLVAIFLPRMELDHLREWIAYHLLIGVSRLFLYNNGHLSVDPAFGKNKPIGRVWHKKPEANFHLDLSDEEVDQRVDVIIDEFGDAVTHYAWPTGGGRGSDFMKCQKRAVNRELRRQEELGVLEWLGHLDLDELLVCSAPLNETLAAVPEDVAAIKLRQKLFESRWRDGASVPYSQITRTFGVVNFNHKLLCRVGRVARWATPHGIVKPRGRVWRFPPKVIRFHHFRGNEHRGDEIPNGYGGVIRYCRLDATRLETDAAHVLSVE